MPRAAATLPGYSKLPGTGRRYRTPSGGTISRRQYENVRARAGGWSNWSAYQRDVHRYRPAVEKLQAGLDYRPGPFDPVRRAMFDVVRLRDQLPRDALGNRQDADSPELVQPGGPLDQYLQALGYREQGDPRPVGDTPRGR